MMKLIFNFIILSLFFFPQNLVYAQNVDSITFENDTIIAELKYYLTIH